MVDRQKRWLGQGLLIDLHMKDESFMISRDLIALEGASGVKVLG